MRILILLRARRTAAGPTTTYCQHPGSHNACSGAREAALEHLPRRASHACTHAPPKDSTCHNVPSTKSSAHARALPGGERLVHTDDACVWGAVYTVIFKNAAQCPTTPQTHACPHAQVNGFSAHAHARTHTHTRAHTHTLSHFIDLAIHFLPSSGRRVGSIYDIGVHYNCDVAGNGESHGAAATPRRWRRFTLRAGARRARCRCTSEGRYLYCSCRSGRCGNGGRPPRRPRRATMPC